MITEEELSELMTESNSVEVLETIGVDVNFLQTLQVKTYECPGQFPADALTKQLISLPDAMAPGP